MFFQSSVYLSAKSTKAVELLGRVKVANTETKTSLITYKFFDING